MTAPDADPASGPSPWDLLVSAAWGLLAATAAAPLATAAARGLDAGTHPWAGLAPTAGVAFPLRVLGGLWVAATLTVIGLERTRERLPRRDLRGLQDRAALHVAAMIAAPLTWAGASSLAGRPSPGPFLAAVGLATSPVAGALLTPGARGTGFLLGVYALIWVPAACTGAVGFLAVVAQPLGALLPEPLMRPALRVLVPASGLAATYLVAWHSHALWPPPAERAA